MRITTLSRRRSSSARRQFLALVTAAFIVLQPVLLPAPPVVAQVTPTIGVPYTQNFDTLPATGSATWTNNSTIPGWFHARTGTGTTIVANNGSSNAGNLYSYGCTDANAPCNVAPNSTTDRALGSLGSGNAAIGNLFWGVRLQNTTGSTITSLNVSYTGEQWRNSAAAAQTVSFSYLVGSPTVTGSLAEFQAAGVAVPQLDFTSPVTGGTAGALNGNLAANRVTLTHSITGLNIPNGTEVMLRWSDPDHTGADHGLAIDDFSVTANGTGPAQSSLSINDVSQDEGNAGQTAFTFTVSLSPADATQTVTVNYATANGTSNPATGGATCDPGVDYITTNGTLTFVPNDTSEQITVQVCGDTTGEPNETFFVNLSGASNASISDAQGLGTITNDDITLLLISQVQGSTPSGNAASPHAGQTVSVRGIVTLLKSNGFFLQEEVGDNDSDPNTSEGIFVFTSAAPLVSVGDQATATGTVVEFNGLTEISTSNANVTVNSTGNTLPTAVTLTPADLPPTANFTQPQLEKYEGMRLAAASLTTVVPNDSFFDVFTVLSSQPRPLREPGIPASDPIPPDPTSGTPDPNIPIWDENPERLLLDTNGRAGSTGETLTSNVVITNVAGPLDFAFGAYRLINEAALNRTNNMSAVPVPTPLASEFTVASYNIENFNNNATQRQKAAQTICDVIRQPDIIGVIEIFDLADLQALAAEVQTRCGVAYSAHLVEANGTSEDSDQDVGYLVKTSRVSVMSVTPERTTDTYINPNNGQPDTTHDRPPYVLRGTVDPSGANPQPVIVVVNHLRSFIDIELVAGEGPRVREKRKKQAESLADLLNDLQTANPGVPVVSVGDYNAFQFNNGYDDPISVVKGNPTPDDQIVVDQSPDLVNPNFHNLIDDLPAAERYSFVFEGTPQALDHHVVNQAALARNTRISIARVNADFPESPAAAFASNAARPERNSDHDPVVSYYSLAAAAPATGALVISELTPRGPLGALDEFVEIFNNTDTPHTVTASDASGGYSVAAEDGHLRCFIPNGTVIPARGHFLCAGAQYIYISDVFPDAFNIGPNNGDIGDSQGVALFNTANPANYNAGTKLDAFGYTTSLPLYREGDGFPFVVVANAPRAYVRTQYNAYEADTGDNGADFISVNARLDVCCDPNSVLGMAGPQNLASPINRGLLTPMSLFDPGAASTAPANRERNATVVPNGQFGTLRFRRRITNNTGQTVTRMRIRVIDITTLQSPLFPAPGKATACAAPCADLRVLSSSDEAAVATTSGPQPTSGTTLELAAYQTIGGGYNSSLNVNQVTNITPVPNGGTINVNILLGVQEKGNARFFVTVEVLP